MRRGIFGNIGAGRCGEYLLLSPQWSERNINNVASNVIFITSARIETVIGLNPFLLIVIEDVDGEKEEPGWIMAFLHNFFRTIAVMCINVHDGYSFTTWTVALFRFRERVHCACGDAVENTKTTGLSSSQEPIHTRMVTGRPDDAKCISVTPHHHPVIFPNTKKRETYAFSLKSFETWRAQR